MTDLPTNIPEFSVSALAGALKQTVEGAFARVRVRGELGRVTLHRSGHMYATLKDADAVLDAVCWRGTLSRLSLRPEQGMEVIATGRITTYAQRSNYQIVIESMELAGAGALLALLEARKKALAAEGLFAEARKRRLPFAPRTIGVVTSPTGAVIRDILHRVEARFPCRVLVWPVAVQGPTAAEQVAAAIRGFGALTSDLRPDVVIVARGGGSLEDLMPFNEEVVVRAAAACCIPLISAVGHETDTTLIDYAADRRAPTPSAAAEMATPVRADLLARIAEAAARTQAALARRLADGAQRAQGLSARLGRPERALERPAQALDIAAERLSRAYGVYLDVKAGSLARLRPPHPRSVVARAAESLARASEALSRAGPRLCDRAAERLAAAGRLLHSLSFEAVLERGYALVRDAATGAPVTSAGAAKPGQRLALVFAHGETVPARVEGQAELF
ncbi:MAG TPA: exodeoxyribonuclease VII large subunit [Rhodospirillaceae bacterium]|mgnify:CR=1 FL=1|jgi:exodeoxyribonuclease VII large subunit|nr:exodeoxyribonuclease VII large subunit [Alphaproteobacteria bacterium]HBH26463.1 exodeoxyribonuclease VII large subunit [Rhodospirillaceae bacterium]